MIYVHFSKIPTANEAVEAKKAFEKYVATFGTKVQRYHANYSAFNSIVFKESITVANQPTAFSGVDVHNQNRIS